MRTTTLLLFLCLCTTTWAKERVVHVLVALCDNEHQGIVKVPAGIGNGQRPGTNLYWGAGYGVRTHFDRAAEWVRVQVPSPGVPHILERVAWKHRDSAVYLVADAYDGRNIREATEDLLRYASGAGSRCSMMTKAVVTCSSPVSSRSRPRIWRSISSTRSAMWRACASTVCPASVGS